MVRRQGTLISLRFEIDDELARRLMTEIYISGLRATTERVHLAVLFRNIAAHLIMRPGEGR